MSDDSMQVIMFWVGYLVVSIFVLAIVIGTTNGDQFTEGGRTYVNVCSGTDNGCQWRDVTDAPAVEFRVVPEAVDG